MTNGVKEKTPREREIYKLTFLVALLALSNQKHK